MLKVGITGGIGAGKSAVADVFAGFGIPVLKADEVSRKLMENDPVLQQQIKVLFGNESYQKGRLNRPFLANIVFGNKEKLALLNALVHPATIKYATDWAKKQNSPYIIKESALFFESGSAKEIDFMIGVSAPKNVRIARIKKRDKLTEKEIEARMSKQLEETEKMKRCNAIILNDGAHPIKEQVEELHQKLLLLAQTKK